MQQPSEDGSPSRDVQDEHQTEQAPNSRHSQDVQLRLTEDGSKFPGLGPCDRGRQGRNSSTGCCGHQEVQKIEVDVCLQGMGMAIHHVSKELVWKHLVRLLCQADLQFVLFSTLADL